LLRRCKLFDALPHEFPYPLKLRVQVVHDVFQLMAGLDGLAQPASRKDLCEQHNGSAESHETKYIQVVLHEQLKLFLVVFASERGWQHLADLLRTRSASMKAAAPNAAKMMEEMTMRKRNICMIPRDCSAVPTHPTVVRMTTKKPMMNTANAAYGASMEAAVSAMYAAAAMSAAPMGSMAMLVA